VAIIHALDHMHQLVVVGKNNFESALLAGEARVQAPKRMVMEMLHSVMTAMRQRVPTLGRERLQELSLALAESRRTERAALLGESAQGSVEAGQALHALDGLRWLDAVGYHVWRAAHHLSAEAPEARDDGDARNQEEFRAD
jgi:phosphate:Na+ symporter